MTTKESGCFLLEHRVVGLVKLCTYVEVSKFCRTLNDIGWDA